MSHLRHHPQCFIIILTFLLLIIFFRNNESYLKFDYSTVSDAFMCVVKGVGTFNAVVET